MTKYSFGNIAFAALVATGLAGMVGCTESPKKEPVRADYNMPSGQADREFLGNLSILDFEGDGLADCVGEIATSEGFTYFYAPGYADKCSNVSPDSTEMDESTRRAFSVIFKATRDLKFVRDHKLWERRQFPAGLKKGSINYFEPKQDSKFNYYNPTEAGK